MRMKDTLTVNPRIKPALDPSFVPAVLWNRAFRARVAESGRPAPLALALEQQPGQVSIYRTAILPAGHPLEEMNCRYVERIVKFLLWQRGGWRICLAGDRKAAEYLGKIYSAGGTRTFDSDVIGRKVYGREIRVESCEMEEVPAEGSSGARLGRNLDGCRIGFDLGGSDRKCAAMVDGKVVFSEEVKWDPYFQKDPQYHLDGVNDTLKRAAARLPRVDAIGGSVAGIIVNNEVRISSLFRGVPGDAFNARIRGMFIEMGRQWGVPFEVANDGEVTALAGSMTMNDNAVLGISMGTSQAGGYVNSKGNITNWINELAFAPVDYRDNAPVDEWSGDAGCGVQYFSQQAVSRLCAPAGIEFPAGMPPADRLAEVQRLMAAGDKRAAGIYETLGVYLGYAIAHYADFYELRNVLVLGRVTSGKGGDTVISEAEEVLRTEFPELSRTIKLRTPGEKDRRHGQAVAAASLPAIRKTGGARLVTDAGLKHDVQSVAKNFQIEGRYVEAAPYGSGHINDTYRVVFDCPAGRNLYIFQRINHNVFKKPLLVMDNIRRVTTHLKNKLAGSPDALRRTLTLIPANDGECFHRDGTGYVWRAYAFIGGSSTYDIIQTARQAYEAARAFGCFQNMLSDLSAPQLHETIPDFHNTPKRFEAFERALADDSFNRARTAKREIEFALKRKAITSVLTGLQAKGKLPVRTTHNDTKLNNVLLDNDTGEGICVIDLDTVMPGLTLYDFGDMVRTMTRPTEEDETDLAKVKMAFPMFEALTRGYLSAAGDVLTGKEKEHLVFSGKLITFEIGLRFLTDYLSGDVYFKIHRDGHNLDRCRCQFKFVESLEEHEDRMAAFVARI